MQVAVTPEHKALGTCDGCGTVGVAVSRFLLEVGDSCGFSPHLCVSCMDRGKTTAVTVSSPEVPKKPPISKRRRRSVAKQERQMAALIGGRTQKASGAMHSDKGDVRLKGVLRGEMKSTVKRSFTLKREVLDKITSECQGLEKPFVQLRFLNAVTLAPEDDWVIIPLKDWSHATRNT